MGRDGGFSRKLTFGDVFQPTRPYGARLLQRNPWLANLPVSTHAPLWGATVNPCMILNQIA